KQLQATKEPISVVLDQLATQGTDQSKLTTFAKVYENFLKKTTLADKTSYHSNTTVTSKDVLKWVRAAIEQVHSTTEEQANTFGQMFSQHRTDSAIEQLQIQLGQSVETGEQLNEQLLSQFEKAISQSRFIQNLSGNNQLQLKLAPKSLGTIMVELTEIDGEMLVKLTASSQMAKEALEANVRELRHMFAPHNVVIEKQAAEPIFVEQPSPYEDMPDQHEPNEQNQQSRQTEQIDHDEETIRFEDLLNQERV
ncbi:MAG TPA: flagellar hook-length control protein FliK, partial [Bacilli bacterium]|nr:flagellar hook-length control protein FliK [Bacilli bacterium]